MLMTLDAIIGCIVIVAALVVSISLVLWSRGRINRIAGRGYRSPAEATVPPAKLSRIHAVADKPSVSAELSRDLSLFHITMMGLGMMIGAGVFIGIGISVREAGPGGLVLAFALNGVIALLTAMSFAELSSAIPRAGGAYNFARIAFGRGPSFLAGWMEWFASCVAGSLYAIVFATYCLDFLHQTGLLDSLPVDIAVAKRIVAITVAGFFLYINYRGASETGKIGAVFTLGQMLFVLAIAAVGISVAVADPSRFQNFKPFLNPDSGLVKLMASMGFIYVAFEGFEVIAQAGDEVIEPKKNIPKAMLYSVLIVTLTYVAVSLATVVAVRPGSVATEPWRWIGSFGETGFGKAVSCLMPSPFVGYLVVTLAVIFSSTSALNATIFSATRASYALGRDHMLHPSFAKISPKRKTPWVALMFSGGILLLVAGLLPTEDVACCASMMFLFLFFLVNICVIKVRLNMGDELTYGYLMPLFPLPPLIAMVCQGVLAVFIIHMSWLAWLIAPLWILGGLAIYFLYSRSRALTTADEILVLEEQKAPVKPGHRIMVAVANPNNALKMVRTTYKLCQVKQAGVELLHMVPVPDQVPLSSAEKYMRAGKEGILETMLYLAPLFQTSTTLRYCRNIARGIVSAVREKHIDTLIMGWPGRRKPRHFAIGSTVDPILELAPCNVLILKDCGGDLAAKRVLVPLAGGPNGALALEVAGILAEPQGGEITAFTVDSRPDGFDIDKFVRNNLHRIPLPPGQVKTKVAPGARVVNAILKEAEQYDLVVLGCTGQSLLWQMTHVSIPETVAKRCAKPLVMVRASGGLRSWLRWWI